MSASQEKEKLDKDNKITFGYIRKTCKRMKFFAAQGIPPEIINMIFVYYYIPFKKNKVVVKVGMLGDSQIGKTQLMVKYLQDKYDEDYIDSLGVNFMEKTIPLKNVYVTISIWDLGGQREFMTLMPLVCSDSKVMLFMFDLTQKQSLFSVKRWYKLARRENKV